jgi:hypothetical protein
MMNITVDASNYTVEVGERLIDIVSRIGKELPKFVTMDEKATKPGEPTCANRDSEHAASGWEELGESN